MRALWASAAALIVLEAVVLWMLAPLQPGALVLQLAWTPRGFGEIVHVWPPEHLARYRAHLPLDMLLLLAYGSFGWLLATRTRLFSVLPQLLRTIAPFMLPLAAAADAVENGLHWWLTAAPRFGYAPVYLTSALCAALKWSLVLAFAALALWAAALGGRERGDA